MKGTLLERILGLSLARPALVVILLTLATFIGAHSMLNMARDVYPDLTVPIFNIITQNPNAAAEEMELLVTLPFERTFSGLPGVTSVRSVSSTGISVVTVSFETEMDYWRARQLVTERMGQVVAHLPPGTDAPVLGSLSSRISEVLILTLSGQDLKAMREFAQFEMRNRLLSVPGVAEVFVVGGKLREFQALVDPARMRSRGVSFKQVEEALTKGNENAAGGFLTLGATEKSVRGVGRVRTLRDVAQTIVSERQGSSVSVADVARVVDGNTIRRGLATLNGEEVVNLVIVKQFGIDTMAVVDRVKNEVKTIRQDLPTGLRISTTYDQTILVKNALSGVQIAIGEGSLLVIAVILVFLGNLRSTLIVTLSLPLGVLLAGIPLQAMGQGLNTMTLGGLAIAVGIMVDASIIMVENIYQRLYSGRDHSLAAVLGAASEVARPIAYATLVIVAVFLPLYMMTGVEGRLFRALAVTVSAVMMASLLLAITITPILVHRWLDTRQGEGEVAFIRWIKKLYVPLLRTCLIHPKTVLSMAVLVTVLAFASLTRLGTAFLPELDEGALMINTYLPSESSLEEVDRVNRQVERQLRGFPEVVEVIRQTGRAEKSEDPMPITLSDVQVNLKPRWERQLGNQELVEQIRKKLEDVPGMVAMFTTPLGMRIDESLAGTTASVSVKLFGPDYARSLHYAAQLQQGMAQISGVSDLKMDVPGPIPQLQIEVDREGAGRYGLSVQDVMEQVRTAIGGAEVGQVVLGQRQYGLLIRLDEPYRRHEQALRDLIVTGSGGTWVHLDEIARLRTLMGASLIRRESVTRRVAIECNVEGRDLGSVVKEVKATVKNLGLPSEYFVRLGGQYESQQRAFRSLALAIALALALVFLLVYLALDSFSQAAIVLGTLPVALVGGIIALHLAGESFNVSSAIGFIALLGIAVQNGLVLFTQVNQLRSEGVETHQAVLTASIDRLRPKLMTASCAMLGFLPLVLSNRPGVEIERPLAIVTVGGLMTSTIFILLVLPTLYNWLVPSENQEANS